MVLSLFSLGAEVTPEIREAQVAIENVFKQVLDEQYSFKNYTSEKVFLTELSNAVSTDSIIVAGTESAYFKAFKDFICNAFHLKCKPSKSITSLIELVHPEFTDDYIAEQANIPTSSTPLLTQDGLYCGFGLKAKKQLLIVLPLDDNRIDYIINNSLLKFIRENMDLSVLSSVDPLVGMTEEASISTHQEKRQEGELFNHLLIKNCVESLESKGITVSLANTKTLDFINNISREYIDLSQIFSISEYSVDKGEMSARDYAVNLAQGALACSLDTLGAAITKVFAMADESGTQKYFMYACVVDKENVNVAKLTAEPGETPPELIYRAVDELFRILIVWAETNSAELKGNRVRTKNSIAKDNRKLKIMKIVVGAMVGLSSIISLILSFLVNNVYGV